MLWDYTQKSRWQFWLKGLVEDVHEFPNVGLGSWWLKKEGICSRVEGWGCPRVVENVGKTMRLQDKGFKSGLDEAEHRVLGSAFEPSK